MIDFHHYIAQAKHYDETLAVNANIIPGNVAGLSYQLYQQYDEPDDVILVYHGGGVNHNAGYTILARQLSTIPGMPGGYSWSRRFDRGQGHRRAFGAGMAGR